MIIRLRLYLSLSAILALVTLAYCGRKPAWAEVGPASTMTAGLAASMASVGCFRNDASSWEGAASCASSACHARPEPLGSKGSEFTTWRSLDPHAQAFSSLATERSRRMAWALHPEKWDSVEVARATEEVTCLKCHVSPLVGTAQGPVAEHWTDGVGCESCHGPARDWLAEHYRRGWNPDGEPAFHRLDRLSLRIQSCIPCHVGSPGADVNHDLIAAGHPRMHFEFAAFQSLYYNRRSKEGEERRSAAHWNPANDLERDPHWEARGWALGQVLVAKALLELLAYRTELEHPPWPELAEFACFSCHRGIRQKPSTGPDPAKTGLTAGPNAGLTAGPNAGLTASAGLPTWSEWPYAMLPHLARAFQHGDGENEAKGGDAIERKLAELNQAMAWPAADPARVANLARELARDLTPLARTVETRPITPAMVESLLLRINSTNPREPAQWESRTQIFLASAALLADLDRTDRARATKFRDSVKRLGEILEQSFTDADGNSLDSPRAFDSGATDALIEELRRQLQANASRSE